MKSKMFCILVCWLVVGLFETAHAGDYDISRDENTRSGTLGEGRVQTGRIIHVRTVSIEPTGTAQATGTSIGAIAGAVLGREMGKNNNNSLFTALGGVVGGLVGNVTADMVARDTAQELIVEKSDGEMMVLTQAGSDMREGDAVYIVSSVGKKRVILR